MMMERTSRRALVSLLPGLLIGMAYQVTILIWDTGGVDYCIHGNKYLGGTLRHGCLCMAFSGFNA
jgi:hypothetical protein